jgi:hypothetical protein
MSKPTHQATDSLDVSWKNIQRGHSFVHRARVSIDALRGGGLRRLATKLGFIKAKPMIGLLEEDIAWEKALIIQRTANYARQLHEKSGLR